MAICKECIHNEMCYATHTDESPACCDYKPVQRWIPVTERVPEENVRVLVHISGKRSYTTLDTDRLQYRNWVRWGNEVTHWMPLPEPPKEDADG